MTSEQLHALGEDISRLYARLRSSQTQLLDARKETVVRLLRMMTLRDCSTGGHMKRVGLQAAAIANLLDQDNEFCTMISVAAVLHDIGKIAIPDSILHKPDRLDADEFELVKLHARHGAQLLQPEDFDPMMQMATEIALYHHEWFDGNGYPYGLAGEDIPLAARIVSVLDVFDALTDVRPYRSPVPIPAAIDHILEGSGTHFDPLVVDAFMQLPKLPQFKEDA